MRIIVVDAVDPDPVALAPAVEALRDGGLVAFPTETVYGLGAKALDATAAARIFAAKKRPSDDPLIVHVRPHWDLGGLFAEVTPTMMRLARSHWPGPLTIVAGKHPDVPDVVTAGLATVAVRAPHHAVAELLLDLVGVPIAAPSANRFSYVSPTRPEHVAADLADRIDVLVDAGPTPIGIESTIVAVEGEQVTVLRRGAIEVEGAQPAVERSSNASPGRMEVHYSPTSPTLALVAHGAVPSRGSGGVVIGFDDSKPVPTGWEVVSLGRRSDVAAVARRLYRVLREVDAGRPARIVIEFTGLGGLGEAIDDRIRRAAGGQSLT